MTHIYKSVLVVLAALLLLPAPAHAQDFTTGLTHHWTLDEDPGGGTFPDSVGSMDCAVVGSVLSVSGPIDNAIDSTQDDYLDCGTPDYGGQTQLTLSAWMRREALLEWLSVGHNNNDADNVSVSYQDNGNIWFTLAGAAAGWDEGYYALDDTAWHLVTMVYNGSVSGNANRLKGFIDGEQVTLTFTGTIPASVPAGPPPVPFYIGTSSPGNYGSDGHIDDVRVYNRALSAADIEALYNDWNPGHIRYNTNFRVAEYTTGASWVPAGLKRYAPQAFSFFGSWGGEYSHLARTSNLSGSADGVTATGSFWFRRGGFTSGTREMIWSSNNGGTASDNNSRFRIEFTTGNRLKIVGRSSAPADVFDIESATQFTDNNWHHVMFSFDLANGAARHLYIDGVSDVNGTPTTHTNTAIDFSMSTPRIALGARHDDTVRYTGELSDFWFDIGRYTDFTQSLNREKFYNNGPVWLGETGTLPFGTAPEVFFRPAGYDDWQGANDGSGGAFTVGGGGWLYYAYSRPGLTPNGLPQTYAIGANTVSAGNGHSCALRADGIAMCWGYVLNAGVGDGTANTRNAPVALYGNMRWKQITSGYAHSCGITENGWAMCWGQDSGHLGVGYSGTFIIYPAWVDDYGDNWHSIESGDAHGCGVKEDNTGWCWGENPTGAVGNGTIVDVDSPVQIPGEWQMISGAWQHSCGLKTDGTIWCWGARTYGQIGDGGSLVGNQTTPIEISDPGPWIQVSTGGARSCGIKSDGTGWCWGARGAIGDGGSQVGTQNTPVQITGGGTWALIHAGANDHACGIKTDGTGWCWGIDDVGQLGDSAGDDSTNTPLQISGGGTWSSIAPGEQHTCGIKSDGVAYCWGWDGTEQRLGNGAGNTQQNTPSTVSGGYSWAIAPEPATGCLNPGRKTGSIIYNTTSDRMQFCNGDDWIAMGPPGNGGGGCSNPAGTEGQMVYNSTRMKMQYCEGSDWITVGQRGEPRGLVGWWQFNDGPGSGTAADTASANTGTLTNMSPANDWVTGHDGTGYALDFDGSNDYVETSDSDTLSFVNGTQDQSFSVSAWVYMRDASDFMIFKKGGTAPSSDLEYFFRVDGGGGDTPIMRLYDSPGNYIGRQYNMNMTPYQNQWIHLATTYDGSETSAGIKIYLNGIRVDNADSSAGTYNSMQNEAIGARIGEYNGTESNGQIDDVRIYNRALSAQEIADLYLATGGTF